MLRLRRTPAAIAVTLIAAFVVFCLPVVAAASASAAPVSTAGVIAPVRVASPAAPTRPGAAALPALTLSADTPAGGICSVPGIGDIAGLLGFCSLGQSGITGSLNNLCQPGVPEPESATSGVNALIKPSADPASRPLATPYNQYGMAGQYWAATNLQCSDMTSLIGNDVSGMIFDFAKALDRVTITVYQSAAGEGILGWLQGVTDHLISGLGNAIYFPYVAVVVVLAAIWLAWQGLIRKRATRTIEGTIWMVVACAAAVWLIGRPADFTGLGKGVSDGVSVALNTAFAHLPSPGQASCLPVSSGDPNINPASFSYTSGRTVVDQNANELWTVLVCKPWLDGEFGTTSFAQQHGQARTAVNEFARPLLWAQAIAVNEHPSTGLIQAKQAAYEGIAQTIQSKDPSAYPLFQGKEWTTRLEIAFAALLAAVVAGVLILLISVTLILLKLAFLLLLIVGPFFLLLGTHPGFGRVIAVRWFEMLVGVLLKQAAVALALSVLLYCYALIMGTSDLVLSWALKILMITLVTVAVFIYRKPFQHLFASVGYSAIGATDRAEADLSKAAATARANTLTAASFAVPGFAGYRVARWARRNPAQAAGLALGAATAVSTASLAAGAATSADGASAGEGGTGSPGSGSPDPRVVGAGAQAGAASRARARGASAGAASGEQAPPLRLPANRGAPASWGQGSPGSPGAGGGGSGRAGGSAARGPAGPASSAGVPSATGASPPALPRFTGSSDQRWPGGGQRPASRRPASPRSSSQRPAGQAPISDARGTAPPRSPAQPGASSGGPMRSLGSRRQPPSPAPAGRRRSARTGPGPAPADRQSSGLPLSGHSSGGQQGSGPWASGPPEGGQAGGEEPQSGPFWLRPIRRRK